MIFVTLGTQKFQFNRLLEQIDELLEKRVIQDTVIAQIGNSNYVPKRFEFYQFIDREKFSELIEEATVVITHGGTGAIINSIKREKKVIAIPRLSKYNEHVDDHQLQIIKEFDDAGLIDSVIDIEDLENKIKSIEKKEFKKYISNTNAIIETIEEYIKTEEDK